MNKKIVLGSIIAVAVLIGISFTGVVGYQTTKSSTIARASPLFSVRSKRAIDEESRSLTCNYFGKDKKIDIPLPKRNSTGRLIEKVYSILREIDEDTLNIVKDFIINRVKMNKHILTQDFNKEIYLLQMLEASIEFENNEDNSDKFGFTIDPEYGIIRCLLSLPIIIIGVIYGFFALFVILFTTIVPTSSCTCDIGCTYNIYK